MILAEPIVTNLLDLEKGLQMYDVVTKEVVLVVAPLLLVIADNPMASDLCDHQGSSATKFCRMCMVCNRKTDCFNVRPYRWIKLNLQKKVEIYEK